MDILFETVLNLAPYFRKLRAVLIVLGLALLMVVTWFNGGIHWPVTVVLAVLGGLIWGTTRMAAHINNPPPR